MRLEQSQYPATVHQITLQHTCREIENPNEFVFVRGYKQIHRRVGDNLVYLCSRSAV